MNNSINNNGKDNKQITIGSKRIDDKYRIYVLDNGNGIKQEDLEYIFDRYYKVDKVHKRSVVGSGIGLSLARSILEAHEFEYGCNSVINEYSEFYFDV